MAKVLLIDDDTALNDALNDFLVFSGHEVDAVCYASQALNKLSTSTYEVIVTDWELPDLSGIKLCETYRGQGGEAPVIMLTGKTSVNDKRIGFAAGVDDYITKPFNFEELLIRLEALLRKAEAQKTAKPKEPPNPFGMQYELLKEIGSGNMGVIYKARHRQLERLVAIKTMRKHVGTGQGEVERFRKEGQALSVLDHPNIARIYDCGITADNVPFLVMEYIEGRGLDAILRDAGPLNWRRAVATFIPLADAMAYVNDVGLIHRDLKPANIMISRIGNTDVPKVVDFGLAKSLMPQTRAAHRLTAEGDVMGSPYYMSPEQCMGLTLDGRSDIFSFGCLMFELLTARLPFVGNDIEETLFLRLRSEAPYMSTVRPDLKLHPQLNVIVGRTLAKNPNDRYQSFHELRNALFAVHTSPV